MRRWEADLPPSEIPSFSAIASNTKEDLTNLYDITVNDEVIDKKLRYTYNNKLFDDFDFKLDIDLNKLNDALNIAKNNEKSIK